MESFRWSLSTINCQLSTIIFAESIKVINMKKLLMIIAAGILLSSCDSESGSGNVITQKRSVAGFTKVSASSGVEVELRKGAQAVSVETDDNLMELVETKVENGELQISIKEHVSLNNATIRIYVTAPELTTVTASAGASIEGKETLNSTNSISLNASAGASIAAALEAPGVDVDASAGGEIKISGRTRSLNVNSSAGANVRAFELLSENTVVEATAGGNANVFASVSLQANASGGGDINYKGAATLVKKEESGGGSVSKED
jgi:hypothetical protein